MTKGRLYRKYFDGTTEYEQYDYDTSSGYLYRIQFTAGGTTTTVWQMTTMDEYSRIRQATIGSTSASWGYDSNNMLSQIAATGVQQYNYSFDVNTGNLNSRTNFLKSKTESFGYDPNNLDQLATVTGPVNASVSYTPDKNGNILTKSDAGTFSYNLTPYAVSDIGNHQNISSTPQSINYYSFEKVQDITEGSKTAEFVYNAGHQRIRMTLKTSGATTKTCWYFGSSCEREQIGSTVTQYIWIGGDAYSAVAVAKKVGTGSWTVYNIFRDHLGTITHLKTGSTISEYSFDAWGRRRDKDDWTYTLSSEPALFADRGFTAHEFLEDFKLYNMNGRMYDPVVGRFLSPDPYIQAPDFSQNYNRYSYALNNPLVYSDPNGEWLIEALVFAAFTYFKTAHDNRNEETGKWAWNPLDWFKDDDFHMEVGVNVNTDFSDFTGYGGFGQWGQPTSSIAYNNNRGVGFGYNFGDGNSSFYYPSYNYNAAEQNALRNIEDARQEANSSWYYGVGVGLNALSTGASMGETFVGHSISFFQSMNEYSAPVALNYTKEINSLTNSTKILRGIGGATIVVGAGLDIIGIFNYYNKGPMHPSAVSPGKAGLNLGMGAYSFYLNPIAGPLYFGVDLFYPGGWTGAINDQSRLIQKNQNILGPSWNMYKDIGGY